MLKRICIRGYKSFRNETVRLEPLTVLFGLNVAGKSNFLDALQLLARLGTAKTVWDAFEPPHRGAPIEAFPLGEGGVRGLLAKTRLTFSIEADLELSEVAVAETERRIEEMRPFLGRRAGVPGVRERNLRYRVKVEMRPATGGLRVADEYLATLNRRGELKRRRRPFIARERGQMLLREERRGRFLHFKRGLDHTLLSVEHSPLYCPHLAATRAELARWKFFRLDPNRMRDPGSLRKTREIDGQGQNLASFLHTLRMSEPRQFDGLEKALHMLFPSLDGIGTAVNGLGEVEFHVMQDGVPIPARLLSGGVLRWLSLMATTATSENVPSLVGIEELENSVWPGHLGRLAEMLKSRMFFGPQCVVVTHSPHLLDKLPVDCLFTVNCHDRRARVTPAADWGPLGYRPGLVRRTDVPPVSYRILRGDFNSLDG